MQIAFNLPHVFGLRSSDVENALALRALLDCTVALNRAVFQTIGRSKKIRPLYETGIVYGRTKLWEPIPALYARGYGDCKSLSAALVAEYQQKGIECRPDFRFARNPNTGDLMFHILVHVPKKNGYDRTKWEDPSRKLGMGSDELAYFKL